MTPQKAFFVLSREGIPLYDIRQILALWDVDFDRVALSEKEIEDKAFFDVLEKLKAGFPAAYLVGHVDLLSVCVRVSPDVLIPRMETEDFLRELFERKDFSGKKVLDLCTGSGFIALAIKKRFPEAVVTGSDISEKALELAKDSAKDNALSVEFLESDFLDSIDGKFDFVISNPPYIPVDSKNVQAPFEPGLALFSGTDGMDSYRRIFPRLEEHLERDGEAYFELEHANAEKIEALAREHLPSRKTEILFDFDGKKRFLHLF